MTTHNERMIDAFEGEELEPTYDSSRREHSTRSTFQRMTGSGQVQLGTTTGAQLLAAGQANSLARVKRVQVTFVVPKNSTLWSAWLGFYRLPEGYTDAASLAFHDAAVLRPMKVISNPDHATYWQAYLPAVNLAGTGALYLVGNREAGGSTLTIHWTARWIEERSI